MKKKSKETHFDSLSFRKISPAELKKILRSHEEWVMSGKANGQRADLVDVDLRGFNLNQTTLRGANLTHAYFVGDYLAGADLIGADLSHANLSRAYLAGVNLAGANLKDSSLTRADLSGADLKGADLRGTDLNLAKLRGADLADADLQSANLRGADLADAYLKGANLKYTKLASSYFVQTQLANANIEHARLYETVFSDTDLTGVTGLDKCIFDGPCTIDHRTLFRSKNLPESFLRGCGLPDSLIDYLPSLLNKPIQFYSCFISYSHKDEPFAKRLYADLQREGVRCWYAPEDLKIGDKIRHSIDDAIRVNDKLLLVLSENSVKSNWVEHEVETALAKEDKNKNTVLFPVRLDDRVMDIDAGWASHVKNTRHIGDFKKWKNHDSYQAGFKRLVRDLKKVLDKK